MELTISLMIVQQFGAFAVGMHKTRCSRMNHLFVYMYSRGSDQKYLHGDKITSTCLGTFCLLVVCRFAASACLLLIHSLT